MRLLAMAESYAALHSPGEAAGNAVLCRAYGSDGASLLEVASGYYSPELGSFISPDTILDGLNRYAYCGNNPINYVDPTGNGWEPSGGGMQPYPYTWVPDPPSSGGGDGEGSHHGQEESKKSDTNKSQGSGTSGQGDNNGSNPNSKITGDGKENTNPPVTDDKKESDPIITIPKLDPIEVFKRDPTNSEARSDFFSQKIKQQEDSRRTEENRCDYDPPPAYDYKRLNGGSVYDWNEYFKYLKDFGYYYLSKNLYSDPIKSIIYFTGGSFWAAIEFLYPDDQREMDLMGIAGMCGAGALPQIEAGAQNLLARIGSHLASKGGVQLFIKSGAAWHLGLETSKHMNLIHIGVHPEYGLHLAFGSTAPYVAYLHVYLMPSFPFVRFWVP